MCTPPKVSLAPWGCTPEPVLQSVSLPASMWGPLAQASDGGEDGFYDKVVMEIMAGEREDQESDLESDQDESESESESGSGESEPDGI